MNHEANGGLENGWPDLSVTKRIHKQLLAEGEAKQAQALEAVVLHNTWGAARATDDPDLSLCSRCGPFTGCPHAPVLHMSRQREVQPLQCVWSTQRLIKEAVAQRGGLWLGCILPAGVSLHEATNITLDDCAPAIGGDFVRLLEETRSAGLDGPVGFLHISPSLRAVGAGGKCHVFQHRKDASHGRRFPCKAERSASRPSQGQRLWSYTFC